MRFSVKYCFSAAVLFSNFILSQTPLDEQFKYSEKLFREEKYFDAVTEFKRLIFFDKDSVYIFEANMFIGRSYKMGAKYFEALKYFTLTEILAESPEEKYSAEIEIVRVNILSGRTAWALRIIDELEKNIEYVGKKDELNYWKGWACIFKDDWEKASESFGAIFPDHELKKLADDVKEQKYSADLARISSLILPGSGQIYTGNYLSGLISLGWNVLWGYLTINSFMEERHFDGIITGNFLWLRFYSGNIQNAEKFAVQKNLEISNNTLEYLRNAYKGEKP